MPPRRRSAFPRSAESVLTRRAKTLYPTRPATREGDVVKKIRLLTPGPTPVPERLSRRRARPIVHHPSPEFEAGFARVRGGDALLCQTKWADLVFTVSVT